MVKTISERIQERLEDGEVECAIHDVPKGVAGTAYAGTYNPVRDRLG